MCASERLLLFSLWFLLSTFAERARAAKFFGKLRLAETVREKERVECVEFGACGVWRNGGTGVFA